MHRFPDDTAMARKIIGLYGPHSTTHALGQVSKLEAMHCHAAAKAWRATLTIIERLLDAQRGGGEKSSEHEAARRRPSLR